MDKVVVGFSLDCPACAEAAACLVSLYSAEAGMALAGLGLAGGGAAAVYRLAYVVCGSGLDFPVGLLVGFRELCSCCKGPGWGAGALCMEFSVFSHLMASPFTHKHSLTLPCVQRII